MKNIVAIARENGYRDLEEILEKEETLKAGDKIYAVNMGKGVLMMEIGTEDTGERNASGGISYRFPRLDLKQNPLYENSGMAYLDTHYYGGIKKYQWVASPMALHGTIVKKDGTSVEISVGENETSR